MISQEEQDKIIQNLLQSRKIEFKKKIDYEYFKYLYEPLSKYVTEIELATMLKISRESYNNMRYNRSKCNSIKMRKGKFNRSRKRKNSRRFIS